LSRICKGGNYIKEAFEILEKKHSNVAKFYCIGGLPFDDYIKLLQQTNVVLDQTNSYGLGMNALFSMAQGKVVMGGADELSNKENKYEFNPAINIIPDVKQIVSAVEMIIEKVDLEEIGYKSRFFVEHYHDHIKVAQQYIDIWCNN
jgi:hypothetical protein